MLIAVINSSSLVSNADVQTMCAACDMQLKSHVLPAWNGKDGSVSFFADKSSVPSNAWLISIIDDNPQVAGALGFHQEQTDDEIDGFIMCKPILDNGGTVLKFDPMNPGQYSVSGTLSHEIIETVGDVFTNKYYDNGNVSWCGELCDPCEQIGYGISVGGIEVAVSDFVCPNFFNPYAKLPQDGPLNYLNTIHTPFTILAGGYSIQRTSGPGSEKQVFGDEMPQWRRDTKAAPTARLAKRTASK